MGPLAAAKAGKRPRSQRRYRAEAAGKQAARLPGSDRSGGRGAAIRAAPRAERLPLPDRDLLSQQRGFPLGQRGNQLFSLSGPRRSRDPLYRGGRARKRPSGPGMLSARSAQHRRTAPAGREHAGNRQKQSLPEAARDPAGYPLQPAGGPRKAAQAPQRLDHRPVRRGHSGRFLRAAAAQRDHHPSEQAAFLRYLRRGHRVLRAKGRTGA